MLRRRPNDGMLSLAGRLARTAAAVVLSIGLLWFGPAPSGAAESSPQEVVEKLNSVLIDVMRKADTLGYRGRLAKLSPVLNTSFNYPLMARISVRNSLASSSSQMSFFG